MSQALRWTDARLPRGRIDIVKQLFIFAFAYYLYRLVRGVVDAEVPIAFVNARGIVNLERSLHLFFEPALQRWALHSNWLIDAANWCYVNSHPAVTTAFLIWLYMARNEAFNFVRNTFLIAMGLALVTYVVFPTAPPRLLPEWGFTDTVGGWVGTGGATAANVFFNPYAAVPSMHVAFAVMTGVPAAMLVRTRALKLAWALYPLLVTFVVIVTANHFWFDCALGVLTAALAALAARLIALRAHAQGNVRPEPIGAQAPA